MQLPTTGVQDSPSPDATQNPADNPADGEEMPSSKDKKHLWMDPWEKMEQPSGAVDLQDP